MAKKTTNARSLAIRLFVSVIAISCNLVALPRLGAQSASQLVTLRLGGFMYSPTELPALQALVTRFEASHKNIKVMVTLVNGDFESLLKSEFVDGTAPDVFDLDSGWSQDFIESGVLEPVNSSVSAQKSFDRGDFYAKLVDAFRSQGKVFAYPAYYSTLGLWYNPHLLAAKHLKPPKTWKAFASDACKLTDKNDGIFGAVLPAATDRWLPFLKGFGGRVLNQHRKQAAINSTNSINALNWYSGLVSKGCAEEPPSASSGAQEVGTGRAAMTFAPSWLSGYFDTTDPNFKYAVSQLPNGPKGSSNSKFAVGYGVNAKSKYKSAAWSLISFLLSARSMRAWAGKTYYLPGRRSIRPPARDRLFLNARGCGVWEWPDDLEAGAFPELDSDINDVANGKMTSSSAVADMSVWISKYL